MDLAYVVKGAVIGLSIAAPVGPIGALCIQRTLAQGRATGLASGLGAATADGIYGAIAGFGLTFVTTFLIAHQDWLRLAGGVFLWYLAYRIATAEPALAKGDSRATGLAPAYLSTFLLTLANPTTILSFIGIFAALGVGVGGPGYATASLFVLGVVLGSALWWLILSFGVGLFRRRLTPQALRWINRVSGAIIAAFGVIALVSLL